MSDIFLSLCLIVIGFTWHLAKRRWPTTPIGPLWVRLLYVTLLMFQCFYSIIVYTHEVDIVGWASAFNNVFLLTLIVIMAILTTIMLLTIERHFLIGIVEEKPTHAKE